MDVLVVCALFCLLSNGYFFHLRRKSYLGKPKLSSCILWWSFPYSKKVKKREKKLVASVRV